MLAHDYKALVARMAQTSNVGPEKILEERQAAEDLLGLAQQECAGYDAARLCAILYFADRRCVADAVLLLADSENVDMFPTALAMLRDLAARTLALEAQEGPDRPARLFG